MDLNLQQIISQIVAFLIMLWVLKRYAFGPIFALMQERQKKIEDEFAAIEQQKKSAQELLGEYRTKMHEIDVEGRKKIQQEIARGREIALDIQKESTKKADAVLRKAEESIKQEISQAKIQLRNDLVEMVIATTEKVLDQKLDSSDKHNIVIEHFADKVKLQ